MMRQIVCTFLILIICSFTEQGMAQEWIVKTKNPENLSTMTINQVKGTEYYLVETDLSQANLEGIKGVELVEPNFTIELQNKTELFALSSTAGQTNDFPSGLQQVKIAVLDTGANFLDSNLLPYLENGMSMIASEDVQDLNGHGSEVTRIITEGAPENLRVVPIKVMNRYGRSSVYTVVEGLYAAKQAQVSIVNLSFGSIVGSTILQDAIDNLFASGITIVSAVGNSGGVGAFYPARYEQVIGVGAHDENKEYASFSQLGEGVDIFVRGTNMKTKNLENEWVTKNGTSYASAYLTKQLSYYETMDLKILSSWKSWLHSFIDERLILNPLVAHAAILNELNQQYTKWPDVHKEKKQSVHIEFSKAIAEDSIQLGSIFALANGQLLPVDTKVENHQITITPQTNWKDGAQLYITTTLKSTEQSQLQEAVTFTVSVNE